MSNAPFILTLDCDMHTNNCEALRQAMCFFLDPKTGHQFAYVQFPQTFHGITKNDLYANILKTIFQVSIHTFDICEIVWKFIDKCICNPTFRYSYADKI